MSIEQFESIAPVLLRAGPFAAPGYEPGPQNLEAITDAARVLIVGAGGLGCELLKDFALSGFRDIHVIDMDTIDVSNLNRQFLFRKEHVGKSKARVAAQVIMDRCPGVKVTAHEKPIQEFPPSWYTQFTAVVAGLDNIDARRWLNETLVDLVKLDENGEIIPQSVIPLIDGGTESFGGQARVFLPRYSSCYECSLSSMAAARGFAICTIRNVPRLPEHCITYALKVSWTLLEEFKDVNNYKMYQKQHESDEFAPSAVTLDKDNVEHMTWLYNRSVERAAEFGIQGVTFNLTMQVVKNIIPAIASTNALISAACVNEALKLQSNSGIVLNNYFMYIGGAQTGTNCETFKYKQNPDCVVCGTPYVAAVDPSMTLGQLIAKIESETGMDGVGLSTNTKVLHLRGIEMRNVDSPVGGLFEPGELLRASDKNKKVKKCYIQFA